MRFYRNRQVKLTFWFLLLHLFSSNAIYSQKIIPYTEIDPILQTAWDEIYPVAYTRITQKDTLGKGIMVLREKNQLIYLYTFLIYFPAYRMEEEKLVADETGGRDILIKLYFRPHEKIKPYSVNLGEFSEKYNLKSVVRWIK
jgi:hypothetical protein